MYYKRVICTQLCLFLATKIPTYQKKIVQKNAVNISISTAKKANSVLNSEGTTKFSILL